jgi:2-oxoglutarate ferredoxin oxidoreductase subunit alpha
LLPPTRYGPADAGTLLVCWGSTYGPCREAVDRLTTVAGGVAMLHLAQVWPLQPEALRRALQADRVVVVEGNARGQFASLLRETGALGSHELVTRYDGMPFTGEGIAREVAP